MQEERNINGPVDTARKCNKFSLTLPLSLSLRSQNKEAPRDLNFNVNKWRREEVSM